MTPIKLYILIFSLLFPMASFAAEPVSAKHGMVVSDQQAASKVGVDILRAGGNAIDAAVAVGYALAVVDPCCGNIGGGGFMTIHLANGKNIFLNFREKAPLRANKNMYLDKSGNILPDVTLKGYRAVAVPGTVLGLDTALQKYGTMTRRQVMAPAINLAKNGFTITSTDVKYFKASINDFRQQPNIAAIFLKNNKPYKSGEILVQQNLANTLQQISDKGPNVFYKGNIAQEIVDDSQAHGGILNQEDFAKYNIEILQPIYCSYRGYTIISAPPPSSGGVALCEMLNVLENFPLHKASYRSVSNVRDIVESMRYGFADRNSQLGDPDFIHNPIDKLTSKTYAYQLSEKIQHEFYAPSIKRVARQHELTDTTHYSVIDHWGNAVAVTYTLNGPFGANIMAGDTGFFLNDEMDDFTAKPGESNKFGLVQSDKNNIQPGKRPLSSMTPTIVMKNGHVFMVLGSPGGSRIITAVLLTILNVIDYNMNIQQAVDAPRFHYQGEPDMIDVEPFGFSFMTKNILKYIMGYSVLTQGTWAAVEAILINPANGNIYGANDVRRPAGKAVGY